MNNDICLKDIQYNYPNASKTALKNINLNIKRGKIQVVMGLSGSGKSTLIRHLNRLIEPTSGKILVEGKHFTSLNKDQLIEFRRQKMSMVFQRFGLFPHKTVLQLSLIHI